MKRRLASLQGVEVAVLAILLVVMIGQTVYLLTYVAAQRQVSQTLTCQAQVNAEFREALTARTAASTRERAAQRAFIQAVVDTPPGETPPPQVFADYLDALAAADLDRANNPLPDNPRC